MNIMPILLPLILNAAQGIKPTSVQESSSF